MLRLNGGIVAIDHGDVALFSDFENHGTMWCDEGQREIRTQISFRNAYLIKPHVQLSVSMIDISNSANFRVDLKQANITHEGFEILFRTWSDTKIARMRVAWTSIGIVPDDGWD